MRFELKVAWRHLISGRGQTSLTIFSVAIAAMVVLFVQITISGMQKKLSANLVETLPHITVKPPDTLPLPMEALMPASHPDELIVSYQQPRFQQRTDIEQWGILTQKLSAYPGVRVAAANVSGNAFLIRGSKRRSVTISGGDPDEQEKITPLQSDLLAGKWRTISSEEIVLGVTLANEMRVGIADRVLLLSAQGVARVFMVAGIFYSGNANDLNQIYMNLRAAQSLLATGQNVSTVQIKLTDPFQANRIARELAAVLPYKVDSWMSDQASFLSILNSQNAVRIFLTGFVLLSSSVAVAAIMIVSVLQKNKQIGILKSMGAKDRQILLIFTLEGLGVAVSGALCGLVGVFFAMQAMSSLKETPPFGGKPISLFTLDFNPILVTQLVFVVIAATVFASIWPARQAARLNPVEVIRG